LYRQAPSAQVVLWFPRGYFLIFSGRFCRFAINKQRFRTVRDRIFIDHDFHDVLLVRQFVHHVEQRVFQDGPQASGTGLARQCFFRNRVQCGRTDFQFRAFHFQQFRILLDQRILRLDQDLDQRLFRQFAQGGDDRQAADEFRDQAELDQVFRLGFEQDFAVRALALALHAGGEADAALFRTVLNDLGEAVEGAAADEHDVGRVDLDEVLVRMLAPALGRYRGHGAFDQFQQGLLDALARDVAGNRRVVGLARNLVDLVDVDDTALGLFDFVVAALQQLLDDVLDVLAHVARFGQRGGVGDDERHIQHARQGLGQQGFTRTGRTDEQDVALGQLDVVLLAEVLEALVMVVHRHRKNALGGLLPDHVLVEQFGDLVRRRQVGLGARHRFHVRSLVADDVVAQVDALVADEDRRSRDELFDLVLTLAAKRAVQKLFAAGGFFVRHGGQVSSKYWKYIANITGMRGRDNACVHHHATRNKKQTPERVCARAFFKQHLVVAQALGDA